MCPKCSPYNYSHLVDNNLQRRHSDRWGEKWEENPEKKNYAEFKHKVYQSRIGNLVRFAGLETGQQVRTGADLDVINQ